MKNANQINTYHFYGDQEDITEWMEVLASRGFASKQISDEKPKYMLKGRCRAEAKMTGDECNSLTEIWRSDWNMRLGWLKV